MPKPTSSRQNSLEAGINTNGGKGCFIAVPEGTKTMGRLELLTKRRPGALDFRFARTQVVPAERDPVLSVDTVLQMDEGQNSKACEITEGGSRITYHAVTCVR